MNFYLFFILRENTNELLFRNFLNHYKRLCSNVSLAFIGESENYPFFGRLITDYGYNIIQSTIVNSKYHLAFDAPLTEIAHVNIPDNEWVIYSDIDEFLDIDNIPFDELDKYDIFKGFLVDRIDEDMTFEKEITDGSSISMDYPREYVFIKAMMTSTPYKIPFYRKHHNLIISGGHHMFSVAREYSPRVSEKYIKLFHYKWRKGLIDHLSERMRYYQHNIDNVHREDTLIYLCELLNQYRTIVQNKPHLQSLLENYCKVGPVIAYEKGIEFYAK